jgi:hypothetical protein
MNGDLRYCLTNAASGDNIQFGVTGTINLTRALPDLARNITIQGPGPASLTVRRDTGGNYRIFNVTSGATVVLNGLTIANGYLDQDIDDDNGGGISNRGTLTVSNSALTGNFAWGLGGGMVNWGTLTVSNSTFSTNYSPNWGGGIGNRGTLTVNNSTLSGNEGYIGGGIYNWSGATLIVSNSTVAGNTAGDGGGGIRNDDYSTLTINNCTIAGNSVRHGFGGGISLQGTSAVRNTIIAGNSATYGPDVLAEAFGSQGHNLIGNTQDSGGYDPTDLLNVDPLVGPLQDNGGPTQTRALLPGSPAIDAGDNTGAPDWDQRGPGFPRIVNGIIDIGSFEVQNGGGGSGSALPGDGPRRPDRSAAILGDFSRFEAAALLRAGNAPSLFFFATTAAVPRTTEAASPLSASRVEQFFATVADRGPSDPFSQAREATRAWADAGLVDWVLQDAGL